MENGTAKSIIAVRYIGTRHEHGTTVIAETVYNDYSTVVEKLDPRYDLRNHSPNGFEWGYGGSGPAQLALAICAHALQDDSKARLVYQDYKWRMICRIKERSFVLYKQEDVLEVIDAICKEKEHTTASQ